MLATLTGRQTASYFVLGKLPRLGSCSSVDWQPQQSAASRFVGSETGVEKVKRKQLQRTGSQVFAPRKARFPSFHIVCRCVFASFDSSTFWLLSLSALFALVLSPMFYDRILHSLPKSNLCFSRAFSETE